MDFIDDRRRKLSATGRVLQSGSVTVTGKAQVADADAAAAAAASAGAAMGDSSTSATDFLSSAGLSVEVLRPASTGVATEAVLIVVASPPPVEEAGASTG